MEEILFKETFTRKQQDALWQYFIDHSTIQKNGYYLILFYIRDENDFYKRLYARFTGNYQRYDKLEKQNENNKQYVFLQKKNADRKGRIVKEIDDGHNYYKKLILFIYRKTRGYLF